MPSRLILPLLLALPCASAAQSIIGARDSLTARVDTIFQRWDRTDSPGCAVGIYRDGRILYARGYGMANLELGVPITPHTMFAIASITKMFTATAVVLLAQDGKLSLADPIRRFFPEMPPYADSITVRQLLDHTSGIDNPARLIALAGGRLMLDPAGNNSFVPSTLDLLRMITRAAGTTFPPGTRVAYNNQAYQLAGELIARASGQSLAAFLATRVFDPLGMRDTRMTMGHALVPDRAQGYSPRGNPFAINMPEGDGTGSAGVWSNIEDFARWEHNWIEPTVGGRALLDSLIVRSTLREGSTIPWALGIAVERYRGLMTYSKDGDVPGFLSTYLRFPGPRWSVAVFCNLNYDIEEPDALARKVAAVYLGPQMTPLSQPPTAWEAALLAEPRVIVPVEELRRLAGVWRDAAGRGSPIRIAGDTIVPPPPLVPLGNNRFRNDRAEWVFDFDATPPRLRIRDRDTTRILERAPVTQPMAAPRLSIAQLAEYAGDYYNAELETIYTLAADSAHSSARQAPDVAIAIRIGGHLFGTLRPVSRDTFAFAGSQLTGMTFVFARDERGRPAGVTIQSAGARSIEFARRP